MLFAPKKLMFDDNRKKNFKLITESSIVSVIWSIIGYISFLQHRNELRQKFNFKRIYYRKSVVMSEIKSYLSRKCKICHVNYICHVNHIYVT